MPLTSKFLSAAAIAVTLFLNGCGDKDPARQQELAALAENKIELPQTVYNKTGIYEVGLQSKNGPQVCLVSVFNAFGPQAIVGGCRPDNSGKVPFINEVKIPEILKTAPAGSYNVDVQVGGKTEHCTASVFDAYGRQIILTECKF